ncbi:MAG: nuclear transport factor 2 family protein [Anaerolineales bacterium]|nr:MAG: nuclear transport factor 2 family protein [Anaerolineales bacterium]
MMKANAKTEAAVLTVLNEFNESYAQRDIDRLMALFAPDDDQIMFGTGADEKRIGRDQIKFQAERDWSQTEALAFNFIWQQISAAGPVAWVAAEGLGQGKVGGQHIEFPLRMTAVLEQRGDEWLLVQSHVSLPSPAQEEGNSVPV